MIRPTYSILLFVGSFYLDSTRKRTCKFPVSDVPRTLMYLINWPCPRCDNNKSFEHCQFWIRSSERFDDLKNLTIEELMPKQPNKLRST